MDLQTTTEIAIQFTRAVECASRQIDPRRSAGAGSTRSRKDMRKRIRVLTEAISKALALLPVVVALGYLDIDDAKIVRECLRGAASVGWDLDRAETAKAMSEALWPKCYSPEQRERTPWVRIDRACGYARIAESRAWRARREAAKEGAAA